MSFDEEPDPMYECYKAIKAKDRLIQRLVKAVKSERLLTCHVYPTEETELARQAAVRATDEAIRLVDIAIPPSVEKKPAELTINDIGRIDIAPSGMISFSFGYFGDYSSTTLLQDQKLTISLQDDGIFMRAEFDRKDE